MSPIEKIVFRSKQQPLVPIGCLGTCIAVALAAKGIRTGNTQKAQVWFRWRVALQGFTILALIGGSMYYDNLFGAERKTEEELAVEKAKMREKLWIEELERRDAEMKDRKKRAEAARLKIQQQQQQQQQQSDSNDKN